MAMLAEVLNAWRRAWYLILPFLATYLVLRLVVAAVVLPVASLPLGMAIATSDRSELTDQDIARFLLTPLGLLGVLGVASLLLTASVLDVAAMTMTIRTGQRQPLAALRGAVAIIGPRLPRILRFSLMLILRMMVPVLPFALAAGAVALWLLSDHDITVLGSRLNQVHRQVQRMTTAAIATAEAKLMAGLSWRVAVGRQSLSRQKARSMRFLVQQASAS